MKALNLNLLSSCSFEDCPPGLFFYNESLCLKTDYTARNGYDEAYCCNTGETFWGGTNTYPARDKLIVTPCEKN